MKINQISLMRSLCMCGKMESYTGEIILLVRSEWSV